MSASPPPTDFKRDPQGRIASPCTNICRMNTKTGWCDGCFRTIDEIVAWSRLDDAGKCKVLAQLPSRQISNSPNLADQHNSWRPLT
ncbi:MAG: hypothetical protein RIQ60_1284 [Pseudomonadota bacterium]|jgi:predicted Fe-S protein YdhL (DUF1289 family)